MYCCLTNLFQSTHPSGVRRSSVPPPSCVDRYFNPRTPVGCDRRMVHYQDAPCNFNPRTPVGCDKIDVYAFLPRLNFNPRTPVGCDSPIPTVAHCCTNFNPRTPVGCDDRIPVAESRLTDFNPRTPVGCDDLAAKVTHVVGISIHAPQWGATNRGYGLPIDGGISIHAPQWGATGAAMKNTGQNTNFNPRTPVGCDILFVFN